MFFPSGLPFRQPVLVGKKKKAAKKSENDKSRRESEVVSVASSSGIDALLGESSIFDDPEPENKRSGISLPSLDGLTDYLWFSQDSRPSPKGARFARLSGTGSQVDAEDGHQSHLPQAEDQSPGQG